MDRKTKCQEAPEEHSETKRIKMDSNHSSQGGEKGWLSGEQATLHSMEYLFDEELDTTMADSTKVDENKSEILDFESEVPLDFLSFSSDEEQICPSDTSLTSSQVVLR